MFQMLQFTILAVGNLFYCSTAAGGLQPATQPLRLLPDVLERLEDPQQVDVWDIRQSPLLQVDHGNVDSFMGPYEKLRISSLDNRELKHTLELIFPSGYPKDLRTDKSWSTQHQYRNVENVAEIARRFEVQYPGSRWTGEWRLTENSYGEKTGDFDIEIIRLLDKEIASLLERCLIWKHKGRSHYLISYHQSNAPKETSWIIGSGNDWGISKILWSTKMDKRDQTPQPSKDFPVLTKKDIILGYDSICDYLHGNGKEMEGQQDYELRAQINALNSENQRFKKEIETLKSEKQSLMEEQESHQTLKEIHHQMLVVGTLIIGFVLLVLVMIIAFVCRMHRRRRDDGIVPDIQQSIGIPGFRSDYRPRSRTIDELHHKFGMNEIDKVTAKEGADLVRIGRPLETAGAERRLSEELFGIDPIISDGKGRTKRTNCPESGTRSEGEK